MRVAWIDVAKGLGILLVVAGHSRLAELPVLGSWVNSFHMPLFFVLAGLCFDEKRYPSLWAYAKRKAAVLAYPYFGLTLFIAIAMTLLCFGPGTNHVQRMFVGVYPGQNVIGFWFVRVLFFVELLYAVAFRFCGRWRAVVVVVSGVAGFFLPAVHDVLRVNAVLVSLLFHELGFSCKRWVLTPAREAVSWRFGLLAGGIFATGALLLALAALGWPYFGYGAVDFHGVPWAAVCVAVLGVAALCCMARLLDGVKGVGCPLAWLGRHSILLLAVHPMSGACRQNWVANFPILAGWPSVACELALMASLMWALSSPLRFFWKWPHFR